MIFASHQVPIAHSMVALAGSPSTFAFRPFQDFICYWTAFNNIYVTVAELKGRRARLKHLKDGTVRTRLGRVVI
jgi:hypothetical protein